MVSIVMLAVLGGVTAMGATAVANGDASSAVNAVHHAIPPGLKVALSHVPSGTHAHQVLTEHLADYTRNGAIGTGGGAGLGAAMRAFTHRVGRFR